MARSASVTLSLTQMAILDVLRRASPKVVRRQDLIYKIWGLNEAGNDNNLGSQLRLLRHKMKHLGMSERIVAVWGVGYYLTRG